MRRPYLESGSSEVLPFGDVSKPTMVCHVTMVQPCLGHKQAAPTRTWGTMVGSPTITAGKAPLTTPIPLPKVMSLDPRMKLSRLSLLKIRPTQN